MLVTDADAMSTTANALFSWHATYAVVPSAEIATYSGSMSWDSEMPLASWIRTPAACSAAFCDSKAANVACATVRVATSTMLTEPTGLLKPVASSASPSLATTIFAPSGVKASMSGNAPTVTLGLCAKLAASKNCTWPRSCFVAPSTATATKPL